MKKMPTQIKEYLNKSYPYYYDKTVKNICLFAFVSFLSFMFSYFFEPFEINETEHKIEFIWILVIHAFIPLPIALIYFRVINRNLKDDITWTLGKEIIHLSMILLMIGVASFLIRDFIYTNPDNWSLKYFFEEINNTFLIGLLLILIVLPLNLERLIHKHTSSLQKLEIKAVQHESKDVLIKIEIIDSDKCFVLRLEDFLYAKVESNYTEIITFSSHRINKALLRITLKDLEEQLKPVSKRIFKTHRSYLVNLNAIVSISGNAQGYQLTLKNYANSIPVSRSNITDFNIAYSQK